jgi:hypothetical protein
MRRLVSAPIGIRQSRVQPHNCVVWKARPSRRAGRKMKRGGGQSISASGRVAGLQGHGNGSCVSGAAVKSGGRRGGCRRRPALLYDGGIHCRDREGRLRG